MNEKKERFIAVHFIPGLTETLKLTDIGSASKEGISISNIAKYKEKKERKEQKNAPVVYKIPLSCGKYCIWKTKQGLNIKEQGTHHKHQDQQQQVSVSSAYQKEYQ